MSDLTIGYNENDFLYSKFKSDNANIITDRKGKVSEDKCKQILEPNNKENFMRDIEQNLQIYLENIDLDEGINNFEDVMYAFTKKGNMKLDDKTNSYDFQTDNGGVITLKQNKYGKIGDKMNLNFRFPTIKSVSVSPFGENIPEGELDGIPEMDAKKAASSNETTSFFTKNEKQPKCLITNKCTKLHYHYQAYYYDDTGENGCKCTPIGNQVYDNNPHSHCELVDTTNLDESQQANLKKSVLAGVDNLNSVDITLESKGNADPSGESLGELSVGVDTSNIVEEVYNYYRSICKNKNKANELRVKKNTGMASDQLYEDANIAYKSAYLKVINMSAGVLAGLAAVYLLTKAKPEEIAKAVAPSS